MATGPTGGHACMGIFPLVYSDSLMFLSLIQRLTCHM